MKCRKKNYKRKERRRPSITPSTMSSQTKPKSKRVPSWFITTGTLHLETATGKTLIFDLTQRPNKSQAPRRRPHRGQSPVVPEQQAPTMLRRLGPKVPATAPCSCTCSERKGQTKSLKCTHGMLETPCPRKKRNLREASRSSSEPKYENCAAGH